MKVVVVRKVMIDSTVYGAALDKNNKVVRNHSYSLIRLVEQGILALGSTRLISSELMDTPNETARSELLELYERLTKIELTVDEGTTSLAEKYAEKLKKLKLEMPKVDALLISLCSINDIDALISWNRRHLVNEAVLKSVRRINKRSRLKTPLVLTPEQLIEDGKFSLNSGGVLFVTE